MPSRSATFDSPDNLTTAERTSLQGGQIGKVQRERTHL